MNRRNYICTLFFLLDIMVNTAIPQNIIHPHLTITKEILCEYDSIGFTYNGTFNYDSLWILIKDLNHQTSQTLLWQNSLPYLQPGIYEISLRVKNSDFDTTWIYPSFIEVQKCLNLKATYPQKFCVNFPSLIYFQLFTNTIADEVKIEVLDTNQNLIYQNVDWELIPNRNNYIYRSHMALPHEGTYNITILWKKNYFDTLVINSQSMEIVFCEETIWLPTAATPNDDGINDFFQVICFDCEWLKLEIFNHDAQIIYTTQDTKYCLWDCKNRNGNIVPEGVYPIKVQARKTNGKWVEKLGTITIIR